jgi:hypothetical protein
MAEKKLGYLGRIVYSKELASQSEIGTKKSAEKRRRHPAGAAEMRRKRFCSATLGSLANKLFPIRLRH